MQKDWLKRQLTKAKQGAPMWSELAEAIQQLVEVHAMPLIERLRNIKSSFTMTEIDLDKKIGELGRFFAIRAVPADIKPIVYMQRLDEIHLKNTVFPLVNTLWREFNGLSVKWEALYAPANLEKYPYGSLLLTKEDMERSNGRYGDMFLTSRGVIRLPVNEVMEGHDFDDMDKVIEDLTREIRVYVEPLLPLHIVFDGHQLELKYTIKEAEEYFYALSEAIGQSEFIRVLEAQEKMLAHQDVGSACAILLTGKVGHKGFIPRYDDIPLDCWTLDNGFLPFYHSEVAEFYAIDKSKTHLRFTESVQDSTRRLLDAPELVSLSDKLEIPERITVAELIDHWFSIASNTNDELSMLDGEELVVSITNSLQTQILKQSELPEQMAMTAAELNDLISGINQRLEHEGYELRFDVTPLDQCMLDSGHFEP